MEVAGLKVVHALPGRVRIKVAQVKNDPSLARVTEQRLIAVPGVQRVKANPSTGSVLVHFDPQEITSLESIKDLSEILTDLVPGLEIEQFGSWLTESRFDLERGPTFARNIADAFGVINTEVRRVSGGLLDLNVVLPLTLGFMGLRTLWLAEKILWPVWYDYFWFSLATFVMLNRPVVEERQVLNTP